VATILTVRGRQPQLAPGVFLAPTATVAGDVHLAAGVSVWFGCVLRSERAALTVGEDTNLQDLTVVHTDEGVPATIGARVTVGHRAILHGCTIEDDVLVGMGAIVLNGARIGRGAVVAAGAVVREGMEVPPATLAVGVPARVLERPVPDVPRPNVANYGELARWYGEALG
jgi:carbonic anhydrase/acetyltransferase-like protein (isoleucine patch superfamily)